MVFAHEAIMRHYSHKAVLSIAIASCVAFGLSTAVWGESLIFPISKVEFDFLTILYVSFIAGPLFGLVAIIFMNSLIFLINFLLNFFQCIPSICNCYNCFECNWPFCSRGYGLRDWYRSWCCIR